MKGRIKWKAKSWIRVALPVARIFRLTLQSFVRYGELWKKVCQHRWCIERSRLWKFELL